MDDIKQLDRSILSVEAFLVDLLELSRKYGIAINANGEIFEMEFPVDFGLYYGIDAHSQLFFV